MSPDQVSVVDVLDVVRDPAMTDKPALAAAGDAGASALRRRDAAVREVLEGVTLRDLVRASGPDATVSELARYRTS
jgi:hypothetical protein